MSDLFVYAYVRVWVFECVCMRACVYVKWHYLKFWSSLQTIDY